MIPTRDLKVHEIFAQFFASMDTVARFKPPLIYRCSAFGRRGGAIVIWLAGAMLWFPGLSQSQDFKPEPPGRETSDALAVSGRLLEVSTLPSPASSSYKDCLQIVEMSLNATPGSQGLPEVILVGWIGFEDRVFSEMAHFPSGAEVSIRMIPFEKAPKELRTMQRADTVTAFGAPLFYADDVKVLAMPPAKRKAPAAGQATVPKSTFTPGDKSVHNMDRLPSSSTPIRRNSIRDDRERISKSLVLHGGDWKAWSSKLKPFYRELRARAISGNGGIKKGRYFFARSYDHRFQEIMAQPDKSPALTMIVALDRMLAERGIDLMVVPFPFKEEVIAGHFSSLAPEDGLLSPQRLRFIDWLLAHDVEVIDLMPDLKEADKTDQAKWLFYDFEDLHPASDGIEIAADVISSRLDRYGFREDWDNLERRNFTFEMPDSYRKRFPMMPETARYPAVQVITEDGKVLPDDAPNSPVLLVGDSFTRAPSLYDVDGASLREHLAYHSGVLPRDLSVAGSAAQTMRNLSREGKGILEGVRVCVFVFAQYPLFVEKEDLNNPSYQWEIVPLP